MAREGLNSSLYPQNNKLDGGALGKKYVKKTSHSSATLKHRASVGSSFKGDSLRSYASGKFSSPNNRESVIPHYLRASTGSCHDFCKHGKGHVSEAKPWHSSSKTVAKTPSTAFSKIRSKENTIWAEKNKVIEAKHRPPQETMIHAEDLNPPPDSKTVSHSSFENIKNEVSLTPIELELTPEKLESAKDVLETELKTSSMPLGHGPLLQQKAVLVDASPSFATSEGTLRKGRTNSKIKDGKLPQASKPSHSSDASQGELRRSRIYGTMKDKKTVAESKPSQRRVLSHSDNLPSSRVSINKIKNLTARKNSNSKPVPLKDQNIIPNAVNIKHPKNEKVSVKTFCSIETDTVKTFAKPVRNRRVAASSYKQDQIEEDTIIRNHHDWEVEEGEGEKDADTGGMGDAASKLITITKDASEGRGKEDLEGKITRTVRKATTTSPKDKDSSPMKLNFKRGKVVQPHSDNNTPIRLKFRGGRISLGNKDGIANANKICKKEGVVHDKYIADPASSKKVVLRHQDVQDKKNDPGLFNSVIEATASKLVESRKGKVKALVGAFETVISLQES